MMQRDKVQIFNRMFVLIFIVNTVINTGQQMINTLVPKYAATLSDAASVVGIVSGMFSFSALLLRPFASPAFDSYSKKKLLLIALAVMCCSMALYASARSIPLILFARALHGMSYGCIGVLCLAMAGDALPNRSLGSGIGIFALAQAVAQAIGPGLGLAIQRKLGFSGAFLAGVGMMVLSFCLTLFIRESDSDRPRPPYALKKESILAAEAVRPSVILFFMSLAQASIVAFLVIYGEKRGIENVGLYFTVHAVCLFASRPLAGRLSDRFGAGKVLVPGILFSVCAFWVISASTQVWHLAAAGALAAFGFGTVQPTVQALSMKRVPRERRGAGASTNYIFTDLGAIGGSYLVGALIDGLKQTSFTEVEAYSAAFRIMTIPMVMAAVYAALAFGRKKEGTEGSDEADRKADSPAAR